MRIKIFIGFFVCALAAEESLPKEGSQKSDKLIKEDVIQSIPTTYDFKYSTGQEGPAQLFREEHRDHDGSVRGKYGYIDPNGKLRVVEYRAGAGGYSASGDIGPDSVAQDQAQSSFRNDPSVRAQADAWNRGQSSNLGNNNWNSQPSGWSSVDPLWNVGALPKRPNFQTVHQTQPASLSPIPQPNRVAAENTPNSWQNRDQNNWQKSERRSDAPIDWNTWNADQKTWTKQTRSGGQHWTSNVNHQWPQPSGNRVSPPSSRWSSEGKPQVQPTDQWLPPIEGTLNPKVGPSTQLGDNQRQDMWSQPQPSAPSSPSTLPDLKEKWTGISTGDQRISIDHQWGKPLAGPPGQIPRQTPRQHQVNWQTQTQTPKTQNWKSEAPEQINWGAPPPTFSIADQWAKRRSEQAPQSTPIQDQVNFQPPNNWHSAVQYDDPSPAQWSQPPVPSEGDIAQPTPIKPQHQTSWQLNQPHQVQFEQPKQMGQANSNQWSNNPSFGANYFDGQPYVHFRIDHTVDPNQPPLRYQYSY